MNLNIQRISAVTAILLLLSGCGSDSENATQVPNTQEQVDTNSGSSTVNKLAPQSGIDSQLFYGNSKHAGLGSLSNNMVIDPSDRATKKATRDSMDIRYPSINTTLTYGENNSYSNLHLETLTYVSNGTAYKVPMEKDSLTSAESQNAADTNLSSVAYQGINYLGKTNYLTVKTTTGDSLLITPDMDSTTNGINFNNKTLISSSYPSFGATVDGYIVIDDADNNKSTSNELQKCNIDMSTCTKIADVNSITKYSHGHPYSDYDITLLGDILGTTESIYISESKIYSLNKATGVVTEKATVPATSSAYALSGSDVYYIQDANIYKSTLDGVVTQLSNDSIATSCRAFTNDMVIYGDDDKMHAVAKDGSNKDSSIEISVTTKTTGQKYPFDLAIGGQYLYTTYSVDTVTGKNTFSACKLENGKKECLEDSYWSAVSAAKSGSLNYDSTYKYTPYAYIRVDTTDNYGGGALKAIDPTKALEDGITMGTIDTYNFQSFVNSKYDDDLTDSDGNIILYAKNDLDFRGDAFMMNLNKENSLVNLTNEAVPDIADINGNTGPHCHGRMCTVCHSFAGGKIYEDKTRHASAIGYNIRFDFQDGSQSILAKMRKGQGENFNVPLESIAGKNFNAVVVNEATNEDVVSSTGYYHEGLEYFNCNYCHTRAGDMRHGAPNAITIED